MYDDFWLSMDRCPEIILRPKQNGRHLINDIFKCIFDSKTVCFAVKMSLVFVPEDPIDNKPTLVPIMAWRRTIIWISGNLVYWSIHLQHSIANKFCGTEAIILTNDDLVYWRIYARRWVLWYGTNDVAHSLWPTQGMRSNNDLCDGCSIIIEYRLAATRPIITVTS